MKKVVGFILASFIGAGLALGTFLFFYPQKESEEAKNTFSQPNYQTNTVNSNSVSYAPNLDFTGAAEKSIHGVVHVKVRSKSNGYENPFYNFLFGAPSNDADPMPVVSTGSGVIISNDGYIITNNHVIDGADVLDITLNDKRTLTAKVIGSDPNTDIALIKIEGTDFPFIPWGNSDELKLGEWVLAVGNPFNLTSTVTAGIVSAKARSINILNRSTALEAFIQTDAAVNPGNSGGALVDIEGRLVGINTAIASPTGSFSGYSFAVPQKIAQKIVTDLLEYGTVQRAFIGISIAEVTSPEAISKGITSTKGVYVSSVADGGAAKEAGIKPADVILKIKDISVNTTTELQEQVGQYRPGDQISVTILRDNKEKVLLVTLRNIDGKTEMVKGEESFEIYGAKFKNVSSSDAAKLRIKGGVQVLSVASGKFLEAGIKQGFIITSINRKAIFSIQDLNLVFQNLEGGIYIEGVYPNGISAYYAFGI